MAASIWVSPSHWFLWIMSVIYMFAFSSLYIQIPGLYGENGLKPVRAVITREPKTWAGFIETPSLLPFTRRLGLDTQHGFELICLAGLLLSSLSIIFDKMRGIVTYLLLWILYHSLYQFGQVFMSFQWDILLLEAGFLAVLVCPQAGEGDTKNGPGVNVGMWMVRWLIFRLMFASGVVKLQSNCPTWWGLTALDWHYESQCIPTPLAWFFHHLPGPFQKFSVAMVYVIEIVIPFLFFVPIRSLRIFAFYSQLALQILIALTGNYNFFNLLTATLCVSLLDVQFFTRGNNSQKSTSNNDPVWVRRLKTLGSYVSYFVALATIATLCALSARFFRLDPFLQMEPKIMFSKTQFDKFVAQSLSWSIIIACASLGWEIAQSFWRAAYNRSFLQTMRCISVGMVAMALFSLTLVPFTTLNYELHSKMPSELTQAYHQLHKLQLTSSYGLFRRMTGVGGRPELIVFGSEDGKVWKEYEFPYKPGNPYRAPPIVAPHQPRLDWQMWFAALGSYEHNDWVLTLGYRLLTGEPTVLRLLETNPFPRKPPAYVKAELFTYRYSAKDAGYSLWWQRSKPKEYLHSFNKNDDFLIRRLAGAGNLNKTFPRSSTNPWLSWLLDTIRAAADPIKGSHFVSVTALASFTLRYFLG